MADLNTNYRQVESGKIEESPFKAEKNKDKNDPISDVTSKVFSQLQEQKNTNTVQNRSAQLGGLNSEVEEKAVDQFEEQFSPIPVMDIDIPDDILAELMLNEDAFEAANQITQDIAEKGQLSLVPGIKDGIEESTKLSEIKLDKELEVESTIPSFKQQSVDGTMEVERIIERLEERITELLLAYPSKNPEKSQIIKHFDMKNITPEKQAKVKQVMSEGRGLFIDPRNKEFFVLENSKLKQENLHEFQFVPHTRLAESEEEKIDFSEFKVRSFSEKDFRYIQDLIENHINMKVEELKLKEIEKEKNKKINILIESINRGEKISKDEVRVLLSNPHFLRFILLHIIRTYRQEQASIEKSKNIRERDKEKIKNYKKLIKKLHMIIENHDENTISIQKALKDLARLDIEIGRRS